MSTVPQSVLERRPAEGIAKCEVPRCPACESARRRQRTTVREHEYANSTTDAFPLMECLDCGAWYLSPRPDVSALDVIYPPNYYVYVLESKSGGDVDAARRGLFSRLASRLFRKRIRPIAKYMGLTAEKTRLDIGCGNGSVLEAMRDEFGIVGTGIDFSEQAVAHCRQRGFAAHACRFEDYAPEGGETYDLVHSSHVIEHVESPLAYMQKAFELTRPGGLNVFITPNTATWEARWFGRHWGGLHVPRHWTLLDPQSARRLGERVGFEHLETCFSTNGTFWTWTFHSLTLPWLGRRLSDALFPSDHRFIESSLWNIARIAAFTYLDKANCLLLGQSSNMLCIFRRPTE